MIKSIIFDLDGTLVDAYPGIHESLNQTLAELELPDVDLETVKRRVGRGVRNLIQQSVPPQLVNRGIGLFRANYEQAHLTGSFLLPDVLTTLDQLRSRNVLLGIASNKPPDFTKNILRHLNLDPYFTCLAGPEGQIQPKPDPSMMNYIMQCLKSAREETLYVGDMTLDAETARNAGVRLALIPTGGHSREELEKIQPDFLLDRFSDLIRIVDAEI